ncbi:uncharacterized protein LOC143290418 [Babylonia areolata]|uniref:uncharacterized protein LOC143290418 n=1 Tax=Babylonia areolata TaxID=304850 RepID=UPI003FD05BCC
MSVTMEEASTAKLYRCGFCSQDFLSYESCLAHLTSHTLEEDQSSTTATATATVSSGERQRGGTEEESGVASRRQSSAVSEKSSMGESPGSLSAVMPSVVNSLNSSTLLPSTTQISTHAVGSDGVSSTVPVASGGVSAAVPVASGGVSAAVTVAGGGVGATVPVASNSYSSDTLVQTSEPRNVVVQPAQPSSILVQTHSSGAFIVKTKSGKLPQVGEIQQSVHSSSEHLTNVKKIMKERETNESANVSLLYDNSVSGEARDECRKQVDSDAEGNSLEHFQTDVGDVCVSSKSEVSKDDDRPYACPECPARYRFLSSLSVHKKRHNGSEPYQCKTCKKKFWHPTNLRVHERVHSEDWLYSCEVCGHGFNQANDLRIHMRIHTGEMPLKCSVKDCSRAFRDPACLRRHMNKHKGVQPHIACDRCSAKFFHPSGLARHYKRHTGQKDHVCHLCKAAFARGDTLKLHMRIHSGQKPYMCSVCKQSFSDRSYCRRHVAKHDESLKPEVISTLKGKYIVKKESEEEEMEGGEEEDSGVVVETAQEESKEPPMSAQNKKPAVNVKVPVEIQVPESSGSDIPYASIEIEIPESDLVNGDGSEEMVYQYGDMLITISRSTVGLAEESLQCKAEEAVAKGTEDVAVSKNSSLPTSNHSCLQQMEHQYSRATDKVLEKQVNVVSSEVVSSDGAGQVTCGLNPVMVKAEGAAAPQPLSEYNEIVTSVLESDLLEGKETQFRIIPGPKEKHRNPRVGEKRWPCPECNAAFFHQAELKRHQTKHTGELPYQCTICGKKVRDPSNLKRHVRTHTGERPYSCHICGKTFRQAGHLSAHVRIHTGQRPYRCNICPATFIEANHLRYHQKVHAGIKPYKCPECDLSFIRNAELKRHSHVHTQGVEGNLKCHLCPAKFFRSDALRQHLSKKHEQNLPYRCDVCCQSFCRLSLLDRHCAKMKHGSSHSSGSAAPPTPKSKCDAENNVVADALCELAAGRRSESVNAKETSGKSSDSAGSVDGFKLVEASTGAPLMIVAHEGEVPTGAATLQMEGSEVTVGSHSNQHFVQRVLIDGGSVSGARVVLVESEGVRDLDSVESTLQVSGSSDSAEVVLPQPVHTYQLQPVHTDSPQTVIMDVTSQPQQASQKFVVLEDSRMTEQCSAVIIKDAVQTVEQVMLHPVENEPVVDLPEDSLTTVIINDGTVCADNNSGERVLDSNSANHSLLVRSQTFNDNDVCGQQSGSQSVVKESPSQQATDCGVASTMQSIVSGALELQTVTPFEVDSLKSSSKGRQARSAGGAVTVKQEVGQVSSHQPFVAPLRTRSGRERKIKVKVSL